jgi:hypothetical protein
VYTASSLCMWQPVTPGLGAAFRRARAPCALQLGFRSTVHWLLCYIMHGCRWARGRWTEEDSWNNVVCMGPWVHVAAAVGIYTPASGVVKLRTGIGSGKLLCSRHVAHTATRTKNASPTWGACTSYLTTRGAVYHYLPPLCRAPGRDAAVATYICSAAIVRCQLVPAYQLGAAGTAW